MNNRQSQSRRHLVTWYRISKRTCDQPRVSDRFWTGSAVWNVKSIGCMKYHEMIHGLPPCNIKLDTSTEYWQMAAHGALSCTNP
jgi:hypothetical protein